MIILTNNVLNCSHIQSQKCLNQALFSATSFRMGDHSNWIPNDCLILLSTEIAPAQIFIEFNDVNNCCKVSIFLTSLHSIPISDDVLILLFILIIISESKKKLNYIEHF